MLRGRGLRCADNTWPVAFQLDGVPLRICGTSFRKAEFALPTADVTMQTAAATSTKQGWNELTITAIPYGMQVSTEIFPVAQSGSVALYRQALQNYRHQQHGRIVDGVPAYLFGQKVEATAHLVTIPVHLDGVSSVLIHEWLFEAGERVWLVRYSIEQQEGESISALLRRVGRISIAGSPDQFRSTSYFAQQSATVDRNQPLVAAEQSADLPTPPWWQGVCDYQYYLRVNRFAPYPLGGSYRGVQACGPRPDFDHVPNVLRVYEVPGRRFAALEWQCVELVMRYMYMAFDTNTYQANGSQVVWNYPGTRLVKVANNGTPGRLPQPGDIVSYGSTTTFGHTNIVTAVQVDDRGNGTMTTLNQNLGGSSAMVRQGYLNYPISNWRIVGDATGWLHDPATDYPDPQPAPLQLEIRGQPTLTEGASSILQAVVNDSQATITWDLDGDGVYEGSGSTSTFSAAEIDGPAVRVIRARATLPSGHQTDATFTITITNAPPTIEPPSSASVQILVGEQLSFDAIKVQDPSSLDGLQARWDWGDGTTQAAVVVANQIEPISYFYRQPGHYSLQLMVYDDDGGQVFYTVAVEVLDPCQVVPLRDTFEHPSLGFGANWLWATAAYQVEQGQAMVVGEGAVAWNERYAENQIACVTITDPHPQAHHHTVMLKADPRGWMHAALLVSYDAATQTLVAEAREGDQWRELIRTPLPATAQYPAVLGAYAHADGHLDLLWNGQLIARTDAGAAYAQRSGLTGVWFSDALHARFDDFRAGQR
ncbi:MAG: hypothetical protein Fur005_39800 [Roseiflexaceae bacterium]